MGAKNPRRTFDRSQGAPAFVHISIDDNLEQARQFGGMTPGSIHRFMGQN